MSSQSSVGEAENSQKRTVRDFQNKWTPLKKQKNHKAIETLPRLMFYGQMGWELSGLCM